MISLIPAHSPTLYQEVAVENYQNFALPLPKLGFKPTHHERFERWADRIYLYYQVK